MRFTQYLVAIRLSCGSERICLDSSLTFVSVSLIQMEYNYGLTRTALSEVFAKAEMAILLHALCISMTCFLGGNRQHKLVQTKSDTNDNTH